MRSPFHRALREPARTTHVAFPALRVGTLLIMTALAATSWLQPAAQQPAAQQPAAQQPTDPTPPLSEARPSADSDPAISFDPSAGNEIAGAIHFLPGAFMQSDGDSVPVPKGYRIVQPGSRVENGAFLEFYSYWSVPDHGTVYEVTADLSELDNTTTGLQSGAYVGDTAIVVQDEITDTWSAYRFTREISTSSSVEDASGIAVPITATDSVYGTDSTDTALRFCLSNHPPEERATEILGDADRFVEHGDELVYVVKNGDRIEIESTWRYDTGSLALTADFSAADDSFEVADVFAWPITSEGDTLVTWRIEYRLDENARTGSDYPVPVRLTATDGGCGRDSVLLTIEIDNDGPEGSPVFENEIPEETGDEELIVYGTAPEGSTDLLVEINQNIEYVLTLREVEGTLTFYDTLALEPGTNHIVAYGRDFVGNRSDPSEEYLLTRQGAPEFKRCVVSWPTPGVVTADTSATQPEFAVQNGDDILFYCYWDNRGEYEVSADFSAIDSQAGGVVWGTRCESIDSVLVGNEYETWNCYQFEYTLSENNLLTDDGDLVIPITAYDPETQFSTTTRAVHFCLNNDPPEHVRTEVISPGVFNVRQGDTLYLVRNGGEIIMNSYWRSTSNLFVRADFSDLDAGFEASRVERSKIDSLSSDTVRVYQIKYTFGVNACCEEGKDPYPLFGYAYVWNTGCGADTSETLLFEMDNEGPTGGPLLDAAAPGQTSRESISLSGTVPSDASGIRASIATETLDDPVIADGDIDQEAGTFSITLPLEPGENVVTITATDQLGNESTDELEFSVFRVSGTTYSIPKPFAPGDEFVLSSLDGWSSVEMEIYNLEGDRVQSTSMVGSPTLFIARWDWNGRNGEGVDVRRGPYLLRIRTRGPEGGAEHEEVRAFVFTR